MKRILFGSQDRVAEFVAARINMRRFLPDAHAIGLERSGRIIAGVVFEGKGANMIVHVAFEGSRHWIMPSYVAACFHYPFIQQGCERLTGFVRSDNTDARRLDEHLGFRPIARRTNACPDGEDIIVYRMLKGECRYIEGKYLAALQRYLD